MNADEHAEMQQLYGQVQRYRSSIADMKTHATAALFHVQHALPADAISAEIARLLNKIIHGDRGEPSPRAQRRRERRHAQQRGRS